MASDPTEHLIGFDRPYQAPPQRFSESPYDEWPPERNFNPPPMGQFFQKKLDDMFGFAESGMPHLRLEWGSTCLWTPECGRLKYLHRVVKKEQVGWLVDVKDKPSGRVIGTKRFPLKYEFGQCKADLPEPGQEHGLPYPDMQYNREIGVPRWWVSQYLTPEAVGVEDMWYGVRSRLRGNFGDTADIGSYPRRGFYFLGFHQISFHKRQVCCMRADMEHRTCFGYYRDPMDMDLDYLKAVWRKNEERIKGDWRDVHDERDMLAIYDDAKYKAEDLARKEREAMRLRIRDTFRTCRQRLTSRKGKSVWVFSTAGGGETKVY